MGPNALPVPDITNGWTGRHSFVEAGGDVYFSPGDKTQDFLTRFYYVFPENLVAFEVFFIPYEHYRMTPETRDERMARGLSGEGSTTGDVNIATHIQLLSKRSRLPDVLFSANFKTASGGNFSDARYTDAMGYHFALSAGKNFFSDEAGQKTLRPYFMVGFYAWQTYRTDNFQNDAFLFGAGLDLQTENWLINGQFGGYSGYHGNGDKPMVIRMTSERKFRRFILKFRLQQDIRDMDYTSVSLSLKYLMRVPGHKSQIAE